MSSLRISNPETSKSQYSGYGAPRSFHLQPNKFELYNDKYGLRSSMEQRHYTDDHVRYSTGEGTIRNSIPTDRVSRKRTFSETQEEKPHLPSFPNKENTIQFVMYNSDTLRAKINRLLPLPKDGLEPSKIGDLPGDRKPSLDKSGMNDVVCVGSDNESSQKLTETEQSDKGEKGNGVVREMVHKVSEKNRRDRLRYIGSKHGDDG